MMSLHHAASASMRISGDSTLQKHQQPQQQQQQPGSNSRFFGERSGSTFGVSSGSGGGTTGLVTAATPSSPSPFKKVLLLGAAESGKTTVFKQLRMIHSNGFSSVEMEM